MPEVPAPALARRLRSFFLDSGYSEPELQRRFGTAEPPVPRFGAWTRWLEATAEPTTLNVLVRLFLLETPVDASAARAALPERAIDGCRRLGLLRADGGRLTPTCLLAPHGELLLAADPFQRMRSGADDHVLTLNPTARLLLDFTLRAPCATTLDLGSGCGIQALCAAAHSERVVATDLNPRATQYVRFNAALNDTPNVEALTGDAFAPVAGRRFDLIVCNPPFVPAPSQRYLWRDSGMELDGFCRELLRHAPAHLEPDGRCQMLCEWVELRGQPWRERVAAWFEGLACDVWVLKGNTQPVDSYVESRIRETLPDSDERARAEYAAWTAHLRGLGVEAVHGGHVVLRPRRTGARLTIEEMPGRPAGRLGEYVERVLAARDFLDERAGDDGLLDVRLRLSADARLEVVYRQDGDGWRPAATELHLTRGLPHRLGLRGDVAAFVARFDGRRTLGELVAGLAREAGVDAARAREEGLALARGLLERGLLEPR